MNIALSAVPGLSLRPGSRNAIAVASGKGGVGKTWFAITLAHALSRRGHRVLLFDGDLGLANVDIQLGLMPKRDLGGVISGQLSLAQATLTFTVDAERGVGFDIIAGHSGSGRLANLPESRLQMLAGDLALLAAGYDTVLLDLGAGVERTVRELAGSAATCAVVTTDEPTAIADAYAFIKLALREKMRCDLSVVVNMASSPASGEQTYRKLFRVCERYLGIAPRLLGVVRRDVRVREAIRGQTPILTRFPTANAAGDVDAIAARLIAGDA